MKKPIWILETVVLKIHAAQLAEHGGSSGIRDKNLLASALNHPQHLWSYEKPSLAELATAYAERLVKNHPFVDGNKRTAYVVTSLFLKLNGWDLTASREERVTKFVELASGKIRAKTFAQWLQENIAKIKIT